MALKYIDPFDKRKVEDFEKDYKKLLEDDRQTHSSKRSASEKRTFKDLIEGRFDVTRVVYIDREDDQDTIFGKAADFSRETIANLEKLGYDDVQKVIQEHAALVVSKRDLIRSLETLVCHRYFIIYSLIQESSHI